jgi:hypothetical protein
MDRGTFVFGLSLPRPRNRRAPAFRFPRTRRRIPGMVGARRPYPPAFIRSGALE